MTEVAEIRARARQRLADANHGAAIIERESDGRIFMQVEIAAAVLAEEISEVERLQAESADERERGAAEIIADKNAQLSALRKALEPFAQIAPLVQHTDVRDGQIVFRLSKPDGGRMELEKRHFRDARAALAPQNDRAEK